MSATNRVIKPMSSKSYPGADPYKQKFQHEYFMNNF